jgi:predicted TIM-barrel fold metal-dependent hydrolase
MCMKDGPAALADPAAGGDLPPAAIDHHLHIQGPDITAELRRKAARSPEIFAQISPELLNPHSGADALAALDEAGIGQGVLLSQAYSFAAPNATPGLDVPALTRRENAYNVEAALASGGRLKTFIGVNPFSAIALDELAYWAGRDGVSGIKLHLANSGFDPGSADAMARLGDFVAAARPTGLPMLIHVKSAFRYAPADTTGFIDRVLAQAGDAVIQIAHGGGGGGLDEPTLSALSLYAEAIERGAAGTQNLFFDLAVVLVRDPAASADLLQRLAALIRRIGLARFLIGSDWPSLCTPLDHNRLLLSQVPLTPAEWQVILANRAPYMA